MKKQCKVISAILISCVLSIAICKQAKAEVEIKDLSNVFDKVTVGGELDLFYRYDKNPWYGYSLRQLANDYGLAETWDDSPSTHWGEIYATLSFAATKNTPLAIITAKAGAMFTETIGQDVYPAFQDESSVELDQAYIKFGKIGNGPIDLTIGRQNIRIEKKFVVGSGFQNPHAALWFAQPDSFAFAVRADGNFGPLKSTLVWARSKDYVGIEGPEGPEGDPTLLGINLHYDFSETAYVYGGVYGKDEKDSDNGGVGNENDSISYDLGVDNTFGGLHLEGEYVYQTGKSGVNGDVDLDARAWFASATYSFDSVKLKPYVQARYVFFSGDNPNTPDNEQYDTGFANTQYLSGALVAEAQLIDSNKKDMVFTVGFFPIESIDMRIEYLQHNFDQKETTIYGPLASDDWATEVDLFVDWFVSDNLFVEFLLGKAMPGDAAKEVFGHEDAYQAYCFMSFSF